MRELESVSLNKPGNYALPDGQASIAFRPINQKQRKILWPFRANLGRLAVPKLRVLI
jgi:hypothetical protein